MEYKALCISNKGYEDFLTVGKYYLDIANRDENYREDTWVTTLDDNGDDESYPAELFKREDM